jgi:hypothetical protein
VKIVDYIMVSHDKPWGLAVEVQLRLKGGWQPQGGVAIRHIDFQASQYHQAMVLYEKEQSAKGKLGPG